MSIVNINQNNFSKEVIQSDRPVLLDFWAPWCIPCRMVAPILDEIARERADVKVAKVNIDEQPELAGRFGIMSIPTLMLFKNGEMVRREVGGKSKEEILEMIGLSKEPVRL